MKFKDLEAGVKFRFDGSDIIYAKISTGTYGLSIPCDGDKECTPEIKDLEIGTWFRFAEGTKRCVKERYIFNAKAEKELRFDDLEVGALFQFVDNELYCLKTEPHGYRIDGENVNCYVNDEVFLLDSKIKRFEDLAVGRWFRHPETQTEFLKVTKCAGRLWGKSALSSFCKDVLIESLTFEEVEK